MRVTRSIAAWSAVVLLLSLVQPAWAQPRAADPAPADRGDATAVRLGMLSVRPLAVDKPWDPHVCIGCDRNNGPASDRRLEFGVRSR